MVDRLEGAAPDLAALALAWDAALQQELPDAVDLRHRLHAAPEVSGAEERTAEVVAAALGGAAEPVAGTGRVLRIGPPGPAVAVRAELDGLPMTERTGVPWASTNGAMHACGHDVHLAAVVAVARAARHCGFRPVSSSSSSRGRRSDRPGRGTSSRPGCSIASGCGRSSPATCSRSCRRGR